VLTVHDRFPLSSLPCALRDQCPPVLGLFFSFPPPLQAAAESNQARDWYALPPPPLPFFLFPFEPSFFFPTSTRNKDIRVRIPSRVLSPPPSAGSFLPPSLFQVRKWTQTLSPFLSGYCQPTNGRTFDSFPSPPQRQFGQNPPARSAMPFPFFPFSSLCVTCLPFSS